MKLVHYDNEAQYGQISNMFIACWRTKYGEGGVIVKGGRQIVKGELVDLVSVPEARVSRALHYMDDHELVNISSNANR